MYISQLILSELSSRTNYLENLGSKKGLLINEECETQWQLLLDEILLDKIIKLSSLAKFKRTRSCVLSKLMLC